MPEAAEVDFAIEPPGSWLLSHVPWTEAEHRITAFNAGGKELVALGISAGAACMARTTAHAPRPEPNNASPSISAGVARKARRFGSVGRATARTARAIASGLDTASG